MKPTRGLVLVVCLLLAMAFPSSALVYGEGVPNGGFEQPGSDLGEFVHWDRKKTLAEHNTAEMTTRTDDRALCTITDTGGDIEYVQCIDTTLWNGTVTVGGWVWMNDDVYNPSDGGMTVELFGEEACPDGSEGLYLALENNGFDESGIWTELSASTIFTAGEASHMRIAVFASSGENVCFDDIDATSQTTAVTLTELRASANTAKAALMAAVLVVTAVYYYWTWRFR